VGQGSQILFSKKTIIEKDGELKIKWAETKPGYKYHIFYELTNSNPANESKREEQFNWLLKYLDYFKAVVLKELAPLSFNEKE